MRVKAKWKFTYIYRVLINTAMKNYMYSLLTLLLAMSLSFNTTAQDVPQSIKDKFAAAYPQATEVEWEAEDGNWEAEYEMGEEEGSVVYDSKGNVLETEVQIAPEDLPKAVRDYILANAGGKKIKEAAKITAANNGAVTWEAEAGGKDYLFDQQGKFLKVEKD